MRRGLLFCLLSMICLSFYGQDIDRKKVWSDAESQVMHLLEEANDSRKGRRIFPRTYTDDTVRLVASGDWTSGFFPGMLWMLFEQTGKPQWKNAAASFTALMKDEPYNRNSHDVGFKVYNSYGQMYRLTGDTAVKTKLIDAARTLASRFDPVTGCIRSWDFGSWQYPVIIDNMMNLELLFAATRISGDSSFYKIAVSHADVTIKNHFRGDFSSFHVVDYDTVTGDVRGKHTHQGFSDASSWARGQAWALYGYTMCYRETKKVVYLEQAKKIAAFIMNHPSLPADKIPYWDYDAAGIPNAPRDASAASITASALYMLAGFDKKGKKYRKMANRIMESLTKNYRAALTTSGGFILLHSTGHKPVNGEVDVPLIYADYYYLEALMKSQKK